MLKPATRLRRLVPVLVLALGPSCSPEREPSGSPSSRSGREPRGVPPRVVLLISIDTLRADHVGIYGYPRPTSPVIDRLGREGTVFDDASSTSPWTLPAHASMLTGLYPNRHGANDVERALGEGIPTLATMLASRGYTTAAVVNSSKVGRLYDLQRGFREFVYVQEVPARVSPSTWITDQAMTWLREFREERLFLFLHYFDVHSDYASLPEVERQFVRAYHGKADGSSTQLYVFGLDPEFLAECRAEPELDSCRTWARIRIDGSVPRIDFDPADRQHLIDLYDAGVRQMDTELGRLMEFLRTEGLLDQCLLILTSDHGEEFLEHGGVLHTRHQYQELLRVPLILRGPGIPSGIHVTTPVSLVDLVPTVLAALGEEAPIALDGLDLSPLWEAEAGSEPKDWERESRWRDRTLFAEADFNRVASNVIHAVRRGHYKLHHNRLTGEVELYDLEADPGEQTNIAEREPAVAAELREILIRRKGTAPLGKRVELSREAIQQLKALGYLLPSDVVR